MPSGAFEITMIPLRFALLYLIAFLALLRHKTISVYVPFFLLCFSTIYSQYPSRRILDFCILVLGLVGFWLRI